LAKTASIAIGLAALVIAPNALWLSRSTVRIENRSALAVESVALEACSQRVELGDLAAGASVFRLLPRCGDDTLIVSARASAICMLYVEGDLYHVRAWFSTAESGDCEYGSPPFSPLLLAELLR
jgi:hypothetical protein